MYNLLQLLKHELDRKIRDPEEEDPQEKQQFFLMISELSLIQYLCRFLSLGAVLY